jgi:hypothetical protein
MGPDVGGAGEGYPVKFDPRNGGATENRNPPPSDAPLVFDGRDHDPSCGGDSMHHQFPWYVRGLSLRKSCFT